jgi:hypothetical protein
MRKPVRKYRVYCRNTKICSQFFSKLKGIKGIMGKMKIELKPGSNPVRHRPYYLNPRVKEKVKKEIDKMLEAGLIFPVEEVEWVSLIVIQSKKDIEDIRVCVDYKILNSACVHDPFPTPFTDEDLEQVEGKEAYSFTDGFSGYHQVRISKEDKEKPPSLPNGDLLHTM